MAEKSAEPTAPEPLPSAGDVAAWTLDEEPEALVGLDADRAERILGESGASWLIAFRWVGPYLSDDSFEAQLAVHRALIDSASRASGRAQLVVEALSANASRIPNDDSFIPVVEALLCHCDDPRQVFDLVSSMRDPGGISLNALEGLLDAMYDAADGDRDFLRSFSECLGHLSLGLSEDGSERCAALLEAQAQKVDVELRCRYLLANGSRCAEELRELAESMLDKISKCVQVAENGGDPDWGTWFWTLEALSEWLAEHQPTLSEEAITYAARTLRLDDAPRDAKLDAIFGG